MSNAFVHSLIQASRAQIKALDICLAELDRQLQSTEPVVDTAIRCPSCNIEMQDSWTYNTMGQQNPQYACQNCDFRGSV